MTIFEGWTLAAARGASRKKLRQIAEAARIGPGVLEQMELARDIDLSDSPFDIVTLERVIDIYSVLGFRIFPRTLLRSASLKRVR